MPTRGSATRHSFHSGMKGAMSRKERQEVDVSGTLEHRLNQMTPEERAADAVELMARVRRRLAEYRQTIEHEPSPEPETAD